MVNELNDIIERADTSSEEDARALVFICANNPGFELPLALLTRYPVYEAYAEYWEKGAAVIRNNRNVLDELFRPVPDVAVESYAGQKISRAARLGFQKKAIKKYLKQNPPESVG